jgi:hypothetical protein
LAAERKRRASITGRKLLALATLHKNTTCRDKKESNYSNCNGSNRSVWDLMIISGNKRSRWIENRNGPITEDSVIEPERDTRIGTLLTSSFKSDKD